MEPRSNTLRNYKSWIEQATPRQFQLVDAIYLDCEKHYEAGGDIIVETFEPAEVLQFKSVKDAKEFIGLHISKELDTRWGEDSDPQVARSKEFDEWNQTPT